MAALLAVTVAACCLGGGTQARWYATRAIAASSLHSAAINLTTNGVRSADWSTTVLNVPLDTTAVYAPATAPTAQLLNAGTATARVSVDGLTAVAAGTTTAADAATLAGSLRAEVRMVTGSTCNATSFAAGTPVADLNPIGSTQSAMLTNLSSGYSLTSGTTATMCIRYELFTSGGTFAAWGRTLTVTWTLLANGGSALSLPVTWKHTVRLMVPPPVAPSGAGAPGACAVQTTLGIVSNVTISWGWPTAGSFTNPSSDPNPASFGLTTNGTVRADLAKTARRYVADANLLTSLLGGLLGGTLNFVFTAKLADGVSTAFTVRLTMNALGTLQSCVVVP